MFFSNFEISVSFHNLVLKKSHLTLFPADVSISKYVLKGNTVVLTPTVSDPKVTYNWQPSAYLNDNTLKNPTVTGDIDRIFTLTVTDSMGCVASSSVTVRVAAVIIFKVSQLLQSLSSFVEHYVHIGSFCRSHFVREIDWTEVSVGYARQPQRLFFAAFLVKTHPQKHLHKNESFAGREQPFPSFLVLLSVCLTTEFLIFARNCMELIFA